MRALRAALTLGAILFGVKAINAEPPPHLEYVKGLRARGLPDLALAYLQSLKNPPPDMAQRLPLELAKTRADLARLEPDPMKRDAIYSQAKQEFLTFLKNSPKNLAAADASLELARMIALQGKPLLTKAERQDNQETRQPDMDKAKTYFQEATKHFQDAIARLTELAGNKDLSDKDKQSLEQTKLHADLELGINLLNQFLSYDEQAGAERAAVARKSLEVLQKTGAGHEKDPLYWIARAWIGRYHVETQDYRSANKELKKVIDEKGAYADAGKRLAKYIQLSVLDKDPDIKDPVAQKIKLADQWRRDYPDFLHTPEGAGVRFHLAEAYFTQAMKFPTTPEGLRLFSLAEKIYDALEKEDTEYSRRAAERKRRIVVTRSTERAKWDITKLQDFQECYLRAQLEIAMLEDEKKNPPKNAKPEELQKKAAQHQNNMLVALNRALELADPKTPREDLAEARFMLTYIYLNDRDDPYRAAILGEDLARTMPQSKRASAAAAYSLFAYRKILAKDEENEIGAAELEASRKRLRHLAAYMEKTWPADPATDEARTILAAIAFHDKDYPEVVRALGQVSSAYANYSAIQQELAAAAMQCHKDRVAPPHGQPPYQEQAIVALRRIPEVASGASAVNVSAFYRGKVNLARLLFTTKKYEEMAKVTAQLTKAFDGAKAKLDKELKDEVEPVLKVLPVYAEYGLADVRFSKGNYEEVLKILDPVITDLGENKLDLKDPKGTRNIRGLALRAHIHEGNTKKAKEILGQILAKQEEGDLEGTSAILNELVVQLRSQVEELREKGPSGQKQLDETVSKFSAFLNDLGKQPDQLGAELVRFLALSYASLHKHEEAAEFLGRIPEPKPASGKESVDPEQLANYRGIQMMHVKELRLAKKFDKAREELKKLLVTDWGKRGFEAKKELHFLWEDEASFGAAAKGWNDMMTNIRPLMEKQAKYKDLYYECYYHVVFCLYKNALTIKDKTRQRENIRKAANWYVKLKQNKPDMGGDELKKLYDDLLQSEELLKRECELLEKGSN
jgi:hypothetical protein